MLAGSLISSLLSIVEHRFLHLRLVVSKIQYFPHILQLRGHLLIKLLEFALLIKAERHTTLRLDGHRRYCNCSEPFVVDHAHQRVPQPVVGVKIRSHEQSIEKNFRCPEFSSKLLSHLRFSEGRKS